MNVFRIIADWSHVTALVIILAKILYTRSCVGISGRSQLLFAMVYTARYADLWKDYIYVSHYNTIMKILFMADAFIVVFLILIAFRKTYQRKRDLCMTEFLLVPCFMFALQHDSTSRTEILWVFSIYLEAVAIVPQFHMILRNKQMEKTILYYLIALGLYRTMYIANWVYRYFTEGYFDPTPFFAAMIYTLIYIIAIPIFIAHGVKISAEGQETYFKRNIFFISSNEPLDTTHLIDDPVSIEKNDQFACNIEKV